MFFNGSTTIAISAVIFPFVVETTYPV